LADAGNRRVTVSAIKEEDYPATGGTIVVTYDGTVNNDSGVALVQIEDGAQVTSFGTVDTDSDTNTSLNISPTSTDDALSLCWCLADDTTTANFTQSGGTEILKFGNSGDLLYLGTADETDAASPVSVDFSITSSNQLVGLGLAVAAVSREGAGIIDLAIIAADDGASAIGEGSGDELLDSGTLSSTDGITYAIVGTLTSVSGATAGTEIGADWTGSVNASAAGMQFRIEELVGDAGVTGTIADVFGGIADAATGDVPITATGADVFGGITDAATGTVGSPVTGTIADVFGGITDAATADVPVAATGADVFGGITDAATVDVPVAATGADVFGGLTDAIQATTGGITATGADVFGGITDAITGVLGGVVTGTITDTFSGITDAATAENPIAATGADVFGGITDALAGVVINADDFNLRGATSVFEL
jgi:hypothetical protein